MSGIVFRNSGIIRNVRLNKEADNMPPPPLGPMGFYDDFSYSNGALPSPWERPPSINILMVLGFPVSFGELTVLNEKLVNEVTDKESSLAFVDFGSNFSYNEESHQGFVAEFVLNFDDNTRQFPDSANVENYFEFVLHRESDSIKQALEDYDNEVIDQNTLFNEFMLFGGQALAFGFSVAGTANTESLSFNDGLVGSEPTLVQYSLPSGTVTLTIELVKNVGVTFKVNNTIVRTVDHTVETNVMNVASALTISIKKSNPSDNFIESVSFSTIPVS